jgi:iron(III) transport system substrate-binding protein
MNPPGIRRPFSHRLSVALALGGVMLLAGSATIGASSDTTVPGTDGEAEGEVPEWQQRLFELQTMPMDELYQHAVEEEDGRVIYWNGNSVIPEDRAGAGPAFEEAYPGMSVTLFGEGSTDEMIARLSAEREAGLQPSGDLFWASMEHASSAVAEGIVAEWSAPEAEAYPEDLVNDHWVIVNRTFHGVVWNANNVSEEEAPASLEDLLDPQWEGRIVAEPRIATQMTAFASHRFADDAAAREYAEALAAQDVTFVPRYPALIQTIASGENDICFNCNLFNAWELLNEGAPIQVMETEAMSLPDAQMIISDPLHPYGAMLMARWMLSVDGGQAVLGAGGKSPSHPDAAEFEIAPRPETLYDLQATDVVDVFPTWDEFCTEVFDLR